jgi:hypothetical protein
VTAQVNYVCWSSANVTATIPTEAATPSDAVLLATHAPLRISRLAGAVGDRSSRVLSESEVLNEFLDSPPNNGVLVATVLGESGAGKSHLIRWVRAKLPNKPGRHVIYLQKTETSLKDVVEALLVNQHDPEFEEIRRRVSGLGSGMTPDEMEHKILAELAEALRTAKADSVYGKALVGEDGLRLFFTDPLFEQHLLRPGSFIERRARHALHGREVDEPDVPLEFTAEELPLDIVDNANIQDAAASTQKLFRRLVANSGMQNEAVRLLNEYLDVAVTKAASLNVGDVGHAFKKIREKLVGQEIVLLIEDVALIQGVRRDLLDAIVEVGVVQGVEKYAAVRTLMAVTPGYYNEQLPETFRRRAEASSPVYHVDIDLEGERSDAEQEDLLVDFVGRYLNAARVGKSALESFAPVVPNACQSCDYRASCQPAFGTSGSGDAEYGLYSYNRTAVLRAIRACAERDGARVLFNPRKVLARAVRDVLTSNIGPIESGTFPPPDFLAEESIYMGLPQLLTHVREQIEEDFPDEDAGRIESLLTFWGNVGTEEVSEEILRAFSHPPFELDLGRAEATAGAGNDDARVGGSGAGSGGAAGELSRSLQKQLDDIEAWSQGQILPQSLVRQLRKIIREALVARIDWFDTVIKEPDTRTMARAVPENARGVSIDGGKDNLPPSVKPLVHLERTARNATTFKGLVLIREGHPARAGDALARLDALVSGNVDEAKRRILAELAVDDASLVQAAASLIRGAAACGVLPARPRDIDYVNACLWRGGSDRPDAAARTPAWMAAYADYVAARDTAVDRLMCGIGAAQGVGGVHALDTVRFFTIVREAKKGADSEEGLEVPTWCSDAQRRLKALLRANAEQITHWQTLIDRIRRYLPENVTFVETVDAIVETVRNGQDQGLVRVTDLHALEELNSTARSWDARGIKEIERLLGDVDGKSGAARLNSVGTVAGADLPRIAGFLESSSQWIEAGILAAEADGGSVADVDTQLNQSVASWLEIVTESES